MNDIRLCDSTFWWRSRHSYSSLFLAILGAYGFLLAGCTGHQAESIQSKQDLNDQIVQIKKENEELKDEVARAKDALAAKEAPSAKEPFAGKKAFAEKEKQPEVSNAKNKKNIQSRERVTWPINTLGLLQRKNSVP